MARVVLQQCLRAKLQVQPAGNQSEAEYVQIDRGIVIYVCFFKGALEELMQKMASSLLNVRLCESSSGRLESVLELPGGVLIVPQASLGGKPKGRSMQYHGNVAKDDGMRLYDAFVSSCQKEAAAAGGGVEVKHGTYGNRQVLQMDTNGPNTHLMDF